jgi:hypothetical protein
MSCGYNIIFLNLRHHRIMLIQQTNNNVIMFLWDVMYWCSIIIHFGSLNTVLIQAVWQESRVTGLTWHCPWSDHVQIACFFDLRSMGWVTITLSFFHHHKVACLLISISFLVDNILIQTKKTSHFVDSPSKCIIMQNHWLTSQVFIEGTKLQY